MKSFLGTVLGALMCLAVGSSFVTGASDQGKTEEAIPFPEVPRMTKEQLKELLGKPGLVLLDCRLEEQFRTSEQVLPGAAHENPMEAQSWAHKYSKDSTIVLY